MKETALYGNVVFVFKICQRKSYDDWFQKISMLEILLNEHEVF